MLGECRILFHSFSLHHNCTDHWQWRLDPTGGYSVRGVYQLMSTQEVHNSNATSDLIWHKQVSLKVYILAWRLLWNRLLSKDNLVACNIISHESQLCMSGCGDVETVQHLIFSYHGFAPMWGLVRLWLNISVADPFLLQDHFIQFVWSSGGSRVRRSFMQLVWLWCVWVLWNERNNRIFKNKESIIHQTSTNSFLVLLYL